MADLSGMEFAAPFEESGQTGTTDIDMDTLRHGDDSVRPQSILEEAPDVVMRLSDTQASVIFDSDAEDSDDDRDQDQTGLEVLPGTGSANTEQVLQTGEFFYTVRQVSNPN